MSNLKQNTTGFTLLELLISMGLVGILLSAAFSLQIKSTSAANALQIRSDLTRESQIAQNYIASKLSGAVYIFPAPTTGVNTLVMNTSGYTSYNPRNSGYVWRLGSGSTVADPLVAFIAPPKLPSTTAGSCSNTYSITDYATRNDAQDQNCYVFYAYFAIPRTQLITGVGSNVPTGINKLDDNASNSWVLMEYRAAYQNGYSTQLSGAPTQSYARIVMDYLRPTTETGSDKLFTLNGNPPTSVTMRLAISRQIGVESVDLPSKDTTKRFSLTVYPRNINSEVVIN